MLNLNNIPHELKIVPQWVSWRASDKCPLKADGNVAASDNPATWTTFEAISGLERIGIMFTPASKLVGIDLDGAVDSNGTIKPWAFKIIQTVASYTEFSPSGTGIHIYAEAEVDLTAKKKKIFPVVGDRNQCIEIYNSGRYFTVTGQALSGFSQFRNAQSDLDGLIAQWNPVRPGPSATAAAIEVPKGQEAEVVQKCLAALDEWRCDDYDEWLRVGMALHSVTNSPEMLKAWDAWSQRSASYEAGCCDAKWETFNQSDGITIGSLVHAAREDQPDLEIVDRAQQEQQRQNSINSIKQMMHINQSRCLNNTALPEIVSGVTDLGEPDPDILAGVLMAGTKLFLSGPSKARKTWCASGLAAAVAAGKPYWGIPTIKTKVLYVNFEILGKVFQKRMGKIREALGISEDEIRDTLDHWHLRGYSAAAEVILPKIIERIKSKSYGLIVLDPLYKLLGSRDENSAGDIADLCNEFERVCRNTGASIVVVHHYAKGDAASKNAIDRSSGSGVLARDPDSLVNLTPHEDPKSLTVSTILRNHPERDEFVVTWQYPLMTLNTDLSPEDLAVRSGRFKDKVTIEEVLKALPSESDKAAYMTRSKLAELLKVSESTIRRKFADNAELIIGKTVHKQRIYFRTLQGEEFLARGTYDVQK